MRFDFVFILIVRLIYWICLFYWVIVYDLVRELVGLGKIYILIRYLELLILFFVGVEFDWFIFFVFLKLE